MLLHAAEQAAFLLVRDVGGLAPHDAHAALLRPVQAEQQLEQCGFSGAGASGQGHVLARLNGERNALQHGRVLVIGKVHTVHGNARSAVFCCGFRDFPLRLRQKSVNAVHARDSRLHGLDFHADALKRREYLRNVRNHGDCGADRHAEQAAHCAVTRGGQHEHKSRHGGAHNEDDRRVNRVVEIRALGRVVAVLDGLVVAAAHEALAPEQVDAADAVQRFGQETGNARRGRAAVHLCAEHSLLHHAREHEQRRNKRDNDTCETGRFHENDSQNADNLAKISRHADDAAGKQILHRVHISDKPGNDFARRFLHKAAGVEPRQLAAEGVAQAARNTLTEHREQALTRRFRNARLPDDFRP